MGLIYVGRHLWHKKKFFLILIISHLGTVLCADKHTQKKAHLMFAIMDIINDVVFTGEDTKAQKD